MQKTREGKSRKTFEGEQCKKRSPKNREECTRWYVRRTGREGERKEVGGCRREGRGEGKKKEGEEGWSEGKVGGRTGGTGKERKERRKDRKKE